MPVSYGLIDNVGKVVSGTGDFKAQKQAPGYFELTFDRPVHEAAVTASARNLQYCDDSPSGMTVCNLQGEDPTILGFFFSDPHDHLGFSFILMEP